MTVEIIHQSLRKAEDEDSKNELVDEVGEGEDRVGEEREDEEDGKSQDWESEETVNQQPKDQQPRDQPGRNLRARATDIDGDDCPVYLVSDALLRNLYFVTSDGTDSWIRTSGDFELQDFVQLHPNDFELAKALRTTAPNLTLNIPKAIPPRWKVRTFVIIGVCVQIAVLSFNAVAVYYWKWTRDGQPVASYGYPTWMAGTVCMSLGISLCARVVQLSTVVHTLAPPEKEKKRFQVVRLQNKITGLNRPAYAIYNFDPSIKVSIRAWPPVVGKNSPKAFHDRTTKALGRKMLHLTVIGASLTMAGFICQNIGTRELHWSAGVFQLGATLFLAALRAWLRRYVGDEPPSELELDDGYEACQLACSLERYCCGSVIQLLTNIAYHRLTSILHPEPFEELPVLEPSRLVAAIGRSTLARAKGRVFSSHASRIINAQVRLTSVAPNSDYMIKSASSIVHAILEILDIIKVHGSFSWNEYMALNDYDYEHDSMSENPKAIVSVRIGVKRAEGQITAREKIESCQKIAAILGLTMRHRFNGFRFMHHRIRTSEQQRWFEQADGHTLPRAAKHKLIRIVGYCNTTTSSEVRERFIRWIGPVAQLDRSPTGEIIAIGDDLDLCTDTNELTALAGYSYSSIFPTV